MALKLQLTDRIAKTLIHSNAHLGGVFTNKKMEEYVFDARKNDGIKIIDIQKSWNKMIMAASAFCAIDNPEHIYVVSLKEFGRKAVQKFCDLTGAQPVTGRFIPGSFSNNELRRNQNNKMKDPRLVIVLDSHSDKQPVVEAAKCSAMTIAFSNTDNELNYVDMVIPTNNRAMKSIGANLYIFANIIRYMKNEIDDIEFDLVNGIESFIYRDEEETKTLAEENEQKEE